MCVPERLTGCFIEERKKDISATGNEKPFLVQKVDWLDDLLFSKEEEKTIISFTVETTDNSGFVSAFPSQLLQLYCLQMTRRLDIEICFQNLRTTCGSFSFFSYSTLRNMAIVEVLLVECRIQLVIKETTTDNRACIRHLSVLLEAVQPLGQWHWYLCCD